MAILRRALLAVLATFVLLFGFGATTAALACSATSYAAETKTDHGDCCGGSDVVDCVPASCTMVYQAVPLAVMDGAWGLKPLSVSYWSKVEPLSDNNSGPEPPPPRQA